MTTGQKVRSIIGYVLFGFQILIAAYYTKLVFDQMSIVDNPGTGEQVIGSVVGIVLISFVVILMGIVELMFALPAIILPATVIKGAPKNAKITNIIIVSIAAAVLIFSIVMFIVMLANGQQPADSSAATATTTA